MAWDSRRPVPWKRLFTLFAVYALVANVALFVIDRDNYGAGAIGGMAFGLVLFLGLAWVMVKLGWNPPSLRPSQAARETAERRAARAEERRTASAPAASVGPRPKPAPTRRTNAGNRRARRR